MSKQTVFLVHGVNPDRDWPNRVRRILGPHFRCCEIEYHEYDGLAGPIRAIIPLTAAVFVLLAVAATPLVWIWLGWRAAVITALVGLAALFGGIFFASFGRRKVLRRRFRPQFESGLPAFGSRPHVIAHSFGTWLTAQAMKVIPTAVFNRVIFTGSVVPRRFSWRRLLTRTKPGAFVHLRNEVGRTDGVVLLAGLLPFRMTEMGYGGLRGFSSCELVHDQQAPRGPCEYCKVGPTVPIHNVWLDDFHHSDAFLGQVHCAELWLPELWGYSPHEVREFFEMCQKIVGRIEDARRAGYPSDSARSLELINEDAKLRNSRWSWTQDGDEPLSLEQFMRRQIELRVTHLGAEVQDPATSKQINLIVGSAIRQLYYIVDDAVRAIDPARPRPRKARYLYPPTALLKAASGSLKDTLWDPTNN